jgi:hypothetical protein
MNTDIDNLYVTNGGYCMHFTVYNQSCYDFFLNQDETKHPIDHVWQDKLKCIVPIPFIATQINTISNISNDYQSTFSKRIKISNNRLLTFLNSNKVKIISD